MNLFQRFSSAGAEVVGVDFLQENIGFAEAHAEKDTELAKSGRLHYVCASIEEYITKIGGTSKSWSWIPAASREACCEVKLEVQLPVVPQEAAFDLVVATEVVEHVDDMPLFVNCCVACVRPGGLLSITTVNRTWPAYIHLILLGEYVLRFITKGTHRYKKFVTPEELRIQLAKSTHYS